MAAYQKLSAESLCDGDDLLSDHFVQLDPVPLSTRHARTFVRSHAPALLEETHDTLLLLTSELVTNAVLHARTVIGLSVLVGRQSLVVGVHDLDLANELQEPYPERESGWGLQLVAVLAQYWTTVRHPEGGKTVWFRLPYEAADEVTDGAAARADAARRDS